MSKQILIIGARTKILNK